MDLTERLIAAGHPADKVFETECRAPVAVAADGRSEDFGRAPVWYAVGAWQAAEGSAVTG
jgi:hypothetical protein